MQKALSPYHMHTSDFDYQLPADLIAQEPLRQRDACRLLVLDKRSGVVKHRVFPDIVDLVMPGDLLVFNDTKVLPARLFCSKASGGNVELLFTEKIAPDTWKALARPGRRLKAGTTLFVKGHQDAGVLRIDAVAPDGQRIVRLEAGTHGTTIAEIIERHGCMPLPPYIRRPAEEGDKEVYQTVYANMPGAVAAPTAGLHFTCGLLETLHKKGAETAFVTLHVGIGTFLPVKVADPREHVMHEEEYEITFAVAEAVTRAKRDGRRVIAVGTTAVRVLEHCALSKGIAGASQGRTSLKILPPYEFKVVDGLITNFHLPQSTLLMLVSAFASRESVLAAYAEAVRERYRFFSYGDAMFIA
jgi:S-adenosylmethionine:tRNA ribosyltransferase-isomerase